MSESLSRLNWVLLRDLHLLYFTYTQIYQMKSFIMLAALHRSM